MKNLVIFLSKSYKISGFDYKTFSIEQNGNLIRKTSKFDIFYFTIFFLIFLNIAIFIDFTADVKILINSEMMHEIINFYSRNSMRIYVPIKIANLLSKNSFVIMQDLKLCCQFVSLVEFLINFILFKSLILLNFIKYHSSNKWM